MSKKNICEVKNCIMPIHVEMRRLCRIHYARLLRTGSVLEKVPVRTRRKSLPDWKQKNI